MRNLTVEEVALITGGYDSSQISTPSSYPSPYTMTWGTTYITHTTYSSGDGGSSGGAPASPNEATLIADALASAQWDASSVNAAEVALAANGLYDGQTVGNTALTPLAVNATATVYADATGHLYADRDGDGVIDTGIVVQSGVASLDINCDGVADQALVAV